MKPTVTATTNIVAQKTTFIVILQFCSSYILARISWENLFQLVLTEVIKPNLDKP